MSAPLNDRDVLLQLPGARYTPPTNRGLFPATTAPGGFKVATNGTATPASIDISAVLIGMTGNVTFTPPAGVTLTGAGNTRTLAFAGMNPSTAVINMAITVDGVLYSRDITITKTFDGAKGDTGATGNTGNTGATGATGARGATSIAAVTTGSAWSNTEAVAALSAAGYGAPQSRDIVTLYKADKTFAEERVYDGTSWLAIAAHIPGNALVDGTVLANALAADAVTAQKIAANAVVARNVAAGTITADKLVLSSNPDNILPDPRFKDLNWWQRNYGFTGVGDWLGQTTSWRSMASLYTYASAYTDTNTKPFPLVPGATYKVEIQVFLSTDFVGQASIYWLVPSSVWHHMGQPNLYSWGRGDNTLGVQHDTNSPKGMRSFSAMYTVPDVDQNTYTVLRVVTKVDAGWIEIGGISITRVTDSTLIGPGSVQTKHLAISTGGDISSGQTGYDLGDGFWLEGVGNGHGARMSVGQQSGAKFLCDPANNVLTFNGGTLINPKMQTSYSVTLADSTFTSQVNTNTYASYGKSPTRSNGVAPYTDSWSFSVSDGDMNLSSSPSAASATVRARGSNVVCVGFLTLNSRDATGAFSTSTCRIYIQFGTGVQS